MIDQLAFSYFNFPKSVLKEALDKFGSAEKILNSSLYELTSNNAFDEKAAEKILQNKSEYRQRAVVEIKKMADFGISVIAYKDPQYPTLLATCNDAPTVLYVMGERTLVGEDEKWISVVGSRSFTDTGRLLTKKLIEDIAERAPQMIIVSSLSDGIESMAHEEAVKLGLRTVGVIASSFDNIRNRDLVSRILKGGGTILSEYPLGQKYFPNCYAERNRIVAGLSHITIVVEAHAESKTLLTAKIAGSYDRDIFAFPGRVTDSSYRGNNDLIRTGEATLALSFEQIAMAMAWPLSKKIKNNFMPQMSIDETRIYECLLDGNEHSDEELMELTGMSAGEFYSVTILMVSNRLISELSGRMYIINRDL